MQATPRPLDPALPFVFYADRPDAMFAAMREIKHATDIRHFLLIAPSKTIRFTGFPNDTLYEAIGDLVGRVRTELEPEGFLISWWNTSTLKVGPNAPLTPITGLGGATNPISYCPLDPECRRRFIRRCEIVAERAQPHMILFEDDYEFSNHGRVGYGCFCEHHLRRFAERAGRAYTREELETCFRSVDETSIVLRRLYAAMMRETLADLAAETAAAVQSLAPATRLGLCQPGCWPLDGNMTEAVTLAFAGRNRPWIRICGASYGTDDPVNLPARMLGVLYTSQNLPEHVEKYYESDTFPHNRFFCSATMLEAMNTLALSYGCADTMLYATHQLPDPLIERGYLEMYRDNRRRFAALREAVKDHEVAGLGLVTRPESVCAAPWTGSGMADNGLGGPINASRLFSRYGFPYTTRPAKARILCGAATARILEPEELDRLLSGPLLLDGDAAMVLTERGYADLIGAAVTEAPTPDFDTEQIQPAAGFEDLAGQVLYSMAYLLWGTEYDTIYAAKPAPETEIITAFVFKGQPVLAKTSATLRQPGLLRFVNRLGGRIVLSPTPFTTRSANFYGYQKRELLRRLIGWLTPEALPAAVLEAPNVSLTANRSRDGASLILTAINLCADPVRNLKLAMAPSLVGGEIERLETSTWLPIAHAWQGNLLEIPLNLTLLKPQILRVRA
jgi:hypothetical protein